MLCCFGHLIQALVSYNVYNVSVEFSVDKYILASKVESCRCLAMTTRIALCRDFFCSAVSFSKKFLVTSGIRIEKDSLSLSILIVADIKLSLRKNYIVLYVFVRKQNLPERQTANFGNSAADVRGKVFSPLVIMGDHAFVALCATGPNQRGQRSIIDAV